MTFNVGGYLFPSAETFALTFGGVNPTITTNAGFTQFFFPLTGSTGFTKSGPGSLQLGGTGIGYTGITTVDAGTLVVSNAFALGNAPATMAASNLVLNNGSTIAFSSPFFDHNFTLTGGTVNLQLTGFNTLLSGSPTLTASTILNLNGTNTTGIFSGNLADTGANVLSLTKSSTSFVNLSGNNSYTGDTTITRGRLQLNSAGALSSGSNLIFNGAIGTGGVLSLTSAFGDFTRGLGAGAGQVQWQGDGGFISSGSNRSVNIGGAGATLTWGAGGFVPDGNRLILGTASNNLLDFQNGIDLSGGVRSIQGDGGLITGHARMSGVLSGTGGINQVGNGFLELTGANTYSGGTVMTSGILVVGSDGNLGDSAGTLTFDGGTLQNIGAFTTARSVTINAPGGTFRTDADLEVSGPISGAGRLTKTATATLTLTGISTYLGGTTISAGTLQIGNGGTAGTIVGDVVDNGVLAFNRSDTSLFDGDISGTGRLEQRGAGTTVLTGTSTFTGGTTISAGTLQIGNGGVTGSLSGNVANSGVFAFDRSDAITFGGIVSGTGSLEQRGPGTLTLTGASTYLGGTVLDAGTVSVAADANLGAASGALTFDGGTLQNTAAFATSRNALLVAGGGTFLTDADLLASGQISGPGTLTKQGAGTLTLTGNNTYSGGTTIDAGTLQIGNGGSSGSIVGDVTDNGVLAFNRSDAITFSGAISGAGILEQRGGGSLTLTGNSAAFAGNSSVSAGTLAVDGILGGTLDVLSGGRLQGTGTVGSTDVASGGTLAPGAPFGTLSVAGNIGFAAGSIYEVKTDAAGTITLLEATGTATIGGGAVNVFTPGSVFQTGERYTILTASGGRAGVFDSLVQSLPLIDMTLAYDANNVFLDVARNSATLCSIASVTPNQCATSTTETSLGTDNPLVAAILSLPNLGSIQNAIDLVSGEIYASANGALINNSHYARDATLARVRQAFGSAVAPAASMSGSIAANMAGNMAGYTAHETAVAEYGTWGQVFRSTGDRSGSGNAATVDTEINGFMVGGDALIADLFRLGIAAGHSKASFNVNERASSGSSDDYSVALYGGTQLGALGMRFGVAYTHHDVEVNRSIVFPGFSDTTKAEYGARTAQVFGEAGYTLNFGELAIEPFAQIAQVGFKTDGFDESGGPAALRLSSSNYDVTYATFGLHAAKTFAGLSDWSSVLHGTLGWRRAFGDTLPHTTNAIGDSSTFVIDGVPIATDSLVVEAGIDVNVADNASFSFTYSGQIARTAMDNGVRANLTIRF